MKPAKIDYRWAVVIVFLSLSLCFIFDLWGKPRVIKENPLVAEKFIANDTVRDPLLTVPKLQQAGFSYECNSCHRHMSPSMEPKTRMTTHQNIRLDHGINNRCYNCHHPSKQEAFIHHSGAEIPFAKTELLCQKCHGPKYRDWAIGVHGRPAGYWDKTRGESTKVTCTACHDPHSPKFKPMEPAPAPINPDASRAGLHNN